MDGKLYFILIPILIGIIVLTGLGITVLGIKKRRRVLILLGLLIALVPTLFSFFGKTIQIFKQKNSNDFIGFYNLTPTSKDTLNRIKVLDTFLPNQLKLELKTDKRFTMKRDTSLILVGLWSYDKKSELISLSILNNVEEILLSPNDNNLDLEFEDNLQNHYVFRRTE